MYGLEIQEFRSHPPKCLIEFIGSNNITAVESEGTATKIALKLMKENNLNFTSVTLYDLYNKNKHGRSKIVKTWYIATENA